MSRRLAKLLLIALIGALSSCASDPNVVNIDLGPASLNDIRQSVFAVIGNPRTTSENQREYESDYFPRKADPKFKADEVNERLYCKVTILGDRRPYTLEVQTLVEAKASGVFELVGQDRGFTDKISSAIQKRLNQSLSHRNIIDDFHAF